MNKKITTIFVTTFLIFSFFNEKFFALSYTDLNTSISEIFYSFNDSNEGTTTFRSLLIPFGGRTESLGSAYTGLCDDISYLAFNPSAASILKETQAAVFHNSWIADSKLDTLAYTTRWGNFGIGYYASCFYLPFTEYNIFGDRVASNYYSESVMGINFAYNFLAGYDFKGFAFGGTIKTGWRQMPNFTDNNTDAIIPNSGLAQSGLALMGDVGFMLQFNFLKFYSSRDPNVRIGFSAQNLGVSFTGWGTENGIVLDDPLPTVLAAGISCKFIKPFTLSIDFKQPVNLLNIQEYHLFSLGAGISVQFTDFLQILGGFEVKGGNPRLSAGFEFEVEQIRINFNYTLDFTTSFNPLNKISVSSKLMLGDRGRSIIAKQVDEYYALGLKYYAMADWESAIAAWQEALKLNKRFDPAILGIESAQYQIDMFKHIEESLKLEQDNQ